MSTSAAPEFEPIPQVPAVAPLQPVRTHRRALRRLLWLIVLAGIAAASVYAYRRTAGSGPAQNLPTAPVRKGAFSVIVRARGELKARRSVQISAPVNVPELRIMWLAPLGSAVKAGDVIVRFDQSSVKQQLQDKQAGFKQAQAALDQAVAQSRVTTEQDKLDVANAQYQVERGKLEVSKGEIVSRLQAEESKVDLGLAEQKLAVQNANTKLNTVSSEARIASLTRARDKAKAELELVEYRLTQMEIRAPLEGVINFMPNYSGGWMNAKPFKVGDQVWPGGILGEIPDLGTLEMEGKIEEIDRGRVVIGQESRVRVDSFPEITFAGKLAFLSPMTVTGWEWPATRTFRGFSKLDKPDPRLRPSMNAAMDIVVERIPNAITVPAKAVFTRQGKPVVYLASGGQFRAMEVEVLARNPDEVAVRGIDGSASIALVEPERAQSLPVQPLAAQSAGAKP